jgi:hypothetical protein
MASPTSTMCPSPRLEREVVLATLGAKVAMPTAVVAAPAAVAKAVLSAPMPGGAICVPRLVAKKVKASKESAPPTLDESAVR